MCVKRSLIYTQMARNRSDMSFKYTELVNFVAILNTDRRRSAAARASGDSFFCFRIRRGTPSVCSQKISNPFYPNFAVEVIFQVTT